MLRVIGCLDFLPDPPPPVGCCNCRFVLNSFKTCKIQSTVSNLLSDLVMTYGLFMTDQMTTVPNGIVVSLEHERLHTILYKPFSVCFGICLGPCQYEHTVSDTVTENHTEKFTPNSTHSLPRPINGSLNTVNDIEQLCSYVRRLTCCLSNGI